MAFTTPIVYPLSNEESAANNGATHQAVITADMLTQTTANTAQTIKIIDLLAGDYIAAIWWKVKTFFKDASDTAFNSDTMSVGDTAAVNTHIAAKEVNANGTTVPNFASNTQVAYTAADKVAVTFNAMSGKKLSDIDVGEVHVFFRLLRPAQLEKAVSGIANATK